MQLVGILSLHTGDGTVITLTGSYPIREPIRCVLYFCILILKPSLTPAARQTHHDLTRGN